MQNEAAKKPTHEKSEARNRAALNSKPEAIANAISNLSDILAREGYEISSHSLTASAECYPSKHNGPSAIISVSLTIRSFAKLKLRNQSEE